MYYFFIVRFDFKWSKEFVTAGGKMKRGISKLQESGWYIGVNLFGDKENCEEKYRKFLISS